jgi:hypothetical protein
MKERLLRLYPQLQDWFSKLTDEDILRIASGRPLYLDISPIN